MLERDIEDIENIGPYFDENSPIEDEYYKGIKNLVVCNYCNKILKNPMMCIECQGAFCQKCTDELTDENHKCKKPTYSKNQGAIALLKNLKYLCNNCKNEIKQENIEAHLNEGCAKNENPTKLMDEIFRKKTLQKLTQDEIKKLSEEKKKVNHLTLILLGPISVGKSSLINTFISKFSVLCDSTTIFDFYTETFRLLDGSYVNCEIIDTGGQEKFNALNKTHYKRADCCVLVYDITSMESFEECENFYHKQIIENCKKDVKVILIGNKTDLEKDRKVKKEDGANFAEKNNYYFRETSCESNFNVSDAFETIIVMTHNDMMKNGEKTEEIKEIKLIEDDEDKDVVKLSKTKKKLKK